MAGNDSGLHLCERCESWCLGKAMGHIEFRTSPETPYKTKDICPGCVGDLMDFLTNPVFGDRAKAYKNPWTAEDTPESGEILARKNMRQFVKELLAGEDDNS